MNNHCPLDHMISTTLNLIKLPVMHENDCSISKSNESNHRSIWTKKSNESVITQKEKNKHTFLTGLIMKRVASGGRHIPLCHKSSFCDMYKMWYWFVKHKGQLLSFGPNDYSTFCATYIIVICKLNTDYLVMPKTIKKK